MLSNHALLYPIGDRMNCSSTNGVEFYLAVQTGLAVIQKMKEVSGEPIMKEKQLAGSIGKTNRVFDERLLCVVPK